MNLLPRRQLAVGLIDQRLNLFLEDPDFLREIDAFLLGEILQVMKLFLKVNDGFFKLKDSFHRSKAKLPGTRAGSKRHEGVERLKDRPKSSELLGFPAGHPAVLEIEDSLGGDPVSGGPTLRVGPALVGGTIVACVVDIMRLAPDPSDVIGTHSNDDVPARDCPLNGGFPSEPCFALALLAFFELFFELLWVFEQQQARILVRARCRGRFREIELRVGLGFARRAA
jgi:hypothetical protein